MGKVICVRPASFVEMEDIDDACAIYTLRAANCSDADWRRLVVGVRVRIRSIVDDEVVEFRILEDDRR